jgi:hypothetical protein
MYRDELSSKRENQTKIDWPTIVCSVAKGVGTDDAWILTCKQKNLIDTKTVDKELLAAQSN